VRLLFDANLSPKLVKQLADLFPGSIHLFDLPLARDVADKAIWTYAEDNGLDIVTADGDDFPPMAKRFGPPPKVILLESWRYPTRIAITLIRGIHLSAGPIGGSLKGNAVFERLGASQKGMPHFDRSRGEYMERWMLSRMFALGSGNLSQRGQLDESNFVISRWRKRKMASSCFFTITAWAIWPKTPSGNAYST
jgi:predicted nuclease of predicted toxin-antitoxin system